MPSQAPRHAERLQRAHTARIALAGRARQWQLALTLPATLRRPGSRGADTALFNAAIDACGRGGAWQSALQLWVDLQAARLSPDVIGATAVVNACGRALQWARALALFEKAKELLQERVDSGLVNVTVSACERGARWAAAIALLESAHRAAAVLDVISFNAAIAACGRSASWQQALALLASLMPAPSAQPTAGPCRPRPDAAMFNAVATACGRASQWPRTLLVLEAARRAGAGPDIVGVSAAIAACAQGAAWVQATALLVEMRWFRLAPNVITFGAAVAACGRAGRWVEAMGLLRDMRAARMPPTLAAFGAAISACEVKGDWPSAVQLLAQMAEANVRADVIAFNATVSACEKGTQWEVACQVLEVLRFGGLAPDSTSFSAAAGACQRAARWQEAVQLLTDASQAGLRPCVVGLAAAAGACELGGQPGRQAGFQLALRRRMDPRSALLAPAASQSGADAPEGVGSFVEGSIASAPWMHHSASAAAAPEALQDRQRSTTVRSLLGYGWKGGPSGQGRSDATPAAGPLSASSLGSQAARAILLQIRSGGQKSQARLEELTEQHHAGGRRNVDTEDEEVELWAPVARMEIQRHFCEAGAEAALAGEPEWRSLAAWLSVSLQGQSVSCEARGMPCGPWVVTL